MDELILPILIFVSIAFVILAISFVLLSIKNHIRKKENNAILDTGDSLVMIWSTDLEVFRCNRIMEMKLSQNGQELTAESVVNIFGNNRTINDYDPTELFENALAEDGKYATLVGADNQVLHSVWHSRIFQKTKKRTVIISIGTDLSEVYQLRKQLQNQEKKSSIFEENYYIAIESAEIGIISIDVKNYSAELSLSQNGKKILGFSEHEQVSLNMFSQKVHPSDINNYTFRLNSMIIGISDNLAIDVRLDVGEGLYHTFIIKFKSIKDKNGDVERITGAMIDVTNQREVYKLYDKSAFEDELTNLPNRRKLVKEGNGFLSISKETNRGTALLFLDLDNFQRLNTLFGFETGDKVLKWFAQALNSYANQRFIAARTGADDFAVLMECEDEDEILVFAEKLKNTLEKHIISDSLKEKVKFKIGACMYNGEDEFTVLYSKAYIALVSGRKTPQKDITFYNDDIERILFEREILENEISEALRREEFELYYQPKISFKTGKIEGMEALIRWHHPTRGLVPPGVFITVAEEIGLITKIDEWGMREACRQNKKWQDAGLPKVKVSVNISQAQLYQTDIIETVSNTLEETGLDAKWLELEVTETMAMKDIDHTIATLHKLKGLGVSISMDDFGSGYSSLSSLKSIPIDILKIDRSLVFDVQENNTARHIASAIISLSKAMKLTTLAEGVETREQGDFLNSLGCDLAQGYYYGKPQTTEEIERYFLQVETSIS